ncbi:hypothetical protein CEXT_164501 [Caerostris extrusa]|uniref:Uncharacterized protein n=1 Tax=Caerostris extrusa TaxID=172846 RepID=A0AAV4P309_CAEEX|nr:hypothetical protein CEXT_164501 [Caerostris extrusa]
MIWNFIPRELGHSKTGVTLRGTHRIPAKARSDLFPPSTDPHLGIFGLSTWYHVNEFLPALSLQIFIVPLHYQSVGQFAFCDHAAATAPSVAVSCD